MLNAALKQKFLSALVFLGASLTAAPPATAATAAAASEASVVVPDEPDSDEQDALAPQVGEDSAARAIFQAWKRLDTGLAAEIGISVPSRKPLDSMRLSSSYGMRVHPITGKLRRHNGIDIPAPSGTPIHATADGIVGRAQRLGGYGNYVEIEHGNAIETRYGHMSSIAVIPGQQVKRGDVIGYVGSTGRSTGNHLHYEVRIEGAPVNPTPFVNSDATAIAALTGKHVAMGGPDDD